MKVRFVWNERGTPNSVHYIADHWAGPIPNVGDLVTVFDEWSADTVERRFITGVAGEDIEVHFRIETHHVDELHERIAEQNMIDASPDLAEALRVVACCQGPERTTIVRPDGEKVDGFRWTHRDGREWTAECEIGEWAPLHPFAVFALRKAREAYE